jgi:hypothetical protein
VVPAVLVDLADVDPVALVVAVLVALVALVVVEDAPAVLEVAVDVTKPPICTNT